jgi:hypothetical protein
LGWRSVKLLTDDHWVVIVEQMAYLRGRVRELEQQNAGLLDRLLIEKGQMPLNMDLRDDMREQEKSHNDLMETLTAEEIGSDPADENGEQQS